MKSSSGSGPKPKSKPKRPKALSPQKLKKKCHDVWAQIVKLRDGKCMVCGSTSGLAAHHFIVSSARSLRHRYDPRNGITLCFGHHIHGVHKEASYAATSRLVEAALAAGNLTALDLSELMRPAPAATEMSTQDLRDKLEHLTTILTEMKTCQKSVNSPKPVQLELPTPLLLNP